MSVVLYAAVAVLTAFLLLIFITLPRMKNQTTEEKLGGRRFAHRGLFDNSGSIPENSMSAFKAAVKCGYGIGRCACSNTRQQPQKNVRMQ